MNISDLLDYLGTPSDWIIPLLTGLVLWSLGKARLPAIRAVFGLARISALRNLKKIKSMRVDAYAVNREIVKEGVLFCSFLLSSTTGLGLMVATGIGRSVSSQLVVFFFLLIPMLFFELWWLIQKDFVKELISQAKRIGRPFHVLTTARDPGLSRTAARLRRQEAIRAQKALETKAKRVRQC